MNLNRPITIPADRTRRIRVLSLGAGVQSTTVYLMAMRGDIPPIDCAIFADTGEEPQEVMRHLEWMVGLGGPKIYIVRKGKLGDDLKRGMNSPGRRFASIPAFTSGVRLIRERDDDGEIVESGRVIEIESTGVVRRQCTKEYKLEPIERFIRRTIAGTKSGQRIPKDVFVTQLIGISLDETARARRIVENNGHKWMGPEFPLLIAGMTRNGCLKWMADRGYPTPPRSACVFCPYKSDREWLRLKNGNPDDWNRAVEIDNALRVPGNVVNRNLEQKLYVHRARVPLETIDFQARIDAKTPDHEQLGFWQECEGMCGN